MNGELERILKEGVLAESREYSRIYTEVLKKNTTINLSQIVYIPAESRIKGLPSISTALPTQ